MSTGAKGKRKTRQGKWKRVIRFGKEGEGGDCAHDSSFQDSAGGRVNSVVGGQ